ncbi:MAG: RHS repeat protein [Lachnospiraceae bacterium]|nr:RHS repeat protein [Lachnospiraceae bacterium]
MLSFQYDLNGNLTRQTDVTGKVTKYRYDLGTE